MKKVLLLLLVVAFATTIVSAQEPIATTQEYIVSVEEWERPRAWRGYETNRFWDNWEIAAGGGASMLQVGRNIGDDPGKFFNRVGWNANISAVKWIVPVMGVRLQVDGGEFQNYSYNQPKYGEGIFKTPYLYVHGDILINMSNWIGGYRPDRIYSAVSYMGFGYNALSFTDKSAGSYTGEYAFTTGFLSKFHITPQWDIELDLRSWFFREGSLPAEIISGNRVAVGLSASVGVAYRFNKRVWTPAYSQADVDGYIAAIVGLEEEILATDVALANLAESAKALESDNERLKNDLAAAKSAQQPMPAKCHNTGEGVVFFTIGEATLTEYAHATLDSYIAAMADCDTPIMITGYADRETGSAERNMQLSKERAESVMTYLVNNGIDAARITTEWVGDTEQAFTTPDTPLVNRCVTLK
jgi:outer membrane protein OmpA-like peptidoglycan-associated protein